MYQTNAPISVPTANLAINKSRIKVYETSDSMPTYYLQKGQEFQIEIYNPTQGTILAKIYLNNQAIAQGGLVLRPAERVFLERYIDVAKKFLFDTYEVENSSEAQKAIEQNGDFKVEFFAEEIVYPTYPEHPVYSYTTNQFNGILRGGNMSDDYSHRVKSFNPNLRSVNSFFSDTNEVSLDSLQMNSTLTSTSDSMLSKSSLSDARLNTLGKQLKSRSRSIETGRVEQGSTSDQKLKTVNKKFYAFPFHSVSYKMLPVSQKVNTIGDIAIKRYCTECGAKQKPEFKFCPVCGAKV